MGEVVYLNNAGTSWPKPEAVHTATAEAMAAPPEQWPALVETSARAVVEFFSLPDPAGFLFTTSCTEALAVGVSSLAWDPGDRVITSALEHHALVRPIADLVRRVGVVHEVAPRTESEPIDLSFVEAELRRGSVRLIACSAASNVTGELLPVGELANLAHAHGAVLFVDAAQTAGCVPMDAGALGIDLFAFAAHKGPHGPQGIGGLYVGPHVNLSTPSASCDVGGRGCGGTLSYCDVGSVNIPAAAGLAAGLRWLTERGMGSVRDRVVAVTGRLLDGLAEFPRVVVHGNRDPHRKTAAISISLGDLSATSAATRLRSRGVITRGGHHCAPMAHDAIGTAHRGTLRLSAGPLTRDEDVDVALAEIQALISA